MNKVMFLIIMTSVFLLLCGISDAQVIGDYTAYPPFVSEQAPPNVLIMFDNSGSMNEFAYKTRGTGNSQSSPDESFNPSYTYYGYFNSTKKYSYSTEAGGHFYEDIAGGWDGNFLNWLTMRRIDITRKVIIGGKAIPRISGQPNYLVTDDSDRDFYKRYYHVDNTYAPFIGAKCFKNDDHGLYVSTDSGEGCANFSSVPYNIKVKFSNTEVPMGILQRTWDRIRFGLMFFNNLGSGFEDGGGGNYDGGYIQDNISGPGVNTNIVTNIENALPTTWGPLGEALYEATRFFSAGTGAYRSANYSATDPQQSKCQKNFVLLLTDGEPNNDRNIPGTYFTGYTSAVTDPKGFNVKTYMDLIAANEGYTSQWAANANDRKGTYYLEGVAYWAHTTDLRSDYWDGIQNITTYTVFTFDESPVGRDLLKKTAKYGGFRDYNNNNKPDLQNEWDENGDGNPDTYFEASEGSFLESALIQAFTDILRRSSSGTAVSVLATTGEGEGSVYQAYFYPERLENLESRKWLGYIHALFVDKYGNLREDTDGNGALDLTTDYIIKMAYDATLGTKIYKYADANGDGIKDTEEEGEEEESEQAYSLETISPIWRGGDKLWEMNPADRTIFTTTDGFNTIPFTPANMTTLKPYLRAADDTESQNIINWIRGDDLTGITDAGHISGYRKRDVTINNVNKVWKLGDIVYSTPTVVGRPNENYDLLYGDSTYSAFRSVHIKRRQVVYVGSNDGMLHAFNAGCFDSMHHKYYPDVTGTGVSASCTTGSHSLGDELWGFIPRGILPHLKWNSLTNYTHVYHVDLKPKITDVKIFDDDGTHVNGWGTILIGGFRYGGKNISWTSGGTNYSASPEYFALDVTDPLNPRLLWTFSNASLGLSMSYPTVAKVGDEWFAIFGSGPTNYDSNSNHTAFQAGGIFVLKISGGANGVVNSWTQNTNFWKISTGNGTAFLADPISVDVDIDNDVDVIYIGENYRTGSNWNAYMRRLTTNKGSQTVPSAWILSTLGDINSIAGTKDVVKRITSSPSAAMDDSANLLVYFGTGQFYGTLDKNQTDTGAFYAIKDGCWDGSCMTSYTGLLDASSASVNTNGSVAGVSGTCAGSVSSWSNLMSASYSCNGWAVYFKNLAESTDFTGNALIHAGERALSKPLVLGGLVTWATYIPGIDVCSYEGESNVYATYYKTGTAYKKYVFKDQADLNTSTNPIGRVKKLGTGMPSSLSAQITSGGTAKGFAQQSTGSILEIESITPLSVKSGIVGWKTEEIR